MDLFVLVLNIFAPFVAHAVAAVRRDATFSWHTVFRTKTILVPVVAAAALVAGHSHQRIQAAAAAAVSDALHSEMRLRFGAALDEERLTRQRLQQTAAHARREHQRIEAAAAEAVALMQELNPELTVLEALGRVGGELRALRSRAAVLEDQVSGIQNYSEVAELNVQGEHQIAEGRNGLSWDSPLFHALDGTWTFRAGQYFPRCDSSTAKLSAVAQRFPDFPFSHLGLALCAHGAGDARWRDHAARALEILSHTAEIAGSHPHHLAGYRLIQTMLAASDAPGPS